MLVKVARKIGKRLIEIQKEGIESQMVPLPTPSEIVTERLIVPRRVEANEEVPEVELDEDKEGRERQRQLIDSLDLSK